MAFADSHGVGAVREGRRGEGRGVHVVLDGRGPAGAGGVDALAHVRGAQVASAWMSASSGRVSAGGSRRAEPSARSWRGPQRAALRRQRRRWRAKAGRASGASCCVRPREMSPAAKPWWWPSRYRRLMAKRASVAPTRMDSAGGARAAEALQRARPQARRPAAAARSRSAGRSGARSPRSSARW